jgi:hypothetical protein
LGDHYPCSIAMFQRHIWTLRMILLRFLFSLRRSHNYIMIDWN